MVELLTYAEESEIEQARAETGNHSRSALQKRIDRTLGRCDGIVGGDEGGVGGLKLLVGDRTRFSLACCRTLAISDWRTSTLGIANALHQPLEFCLYMRLIIVDPAIGLIAHNRFPFVP